MRERQIYELINSLIKDYAFLLSEEDRTTIDECLDEDGPYNKKSTLLEPIVAKIWDHELQSDQYAIISWNKNVNGPNRSLVTFATISQRDDLITFCDAQEGLEYAITYDSILGALAKDAATVIEDISRKNEFTIATINDKVINSYNGATRLITPKQLLDSSNNDYRSKHNELILDSKKICEIGQIKRSK